MKQNNYKKSILLSSITSILLISCSFLIGKKEFFLILNNDCGNAADIFFTYITHLGDGLMFVPLVLYFILTKNKEAWISSLLIIAVSTLLVHLNKQVLFSNISRPYYAISNTSIIHTVAEVKIHQFNSFPSGHTTTAFCVYLIITQFTSWRGWWLIGFTIALLVAYSRIYLAQHFPLDAGAGILIAAISSLIIKKIRS